MKSMHYQILQCKQSQKFFDYNMCYNFEKAKKIFNFNDFIVVYEGDIDLRDTNVDNNLNMIYYMFNVKKPKDFTGHSLSVGDIVKLEDSYYYICAYGFDKLEI